MLEKMVFCLVYDENKIAGAAALSMGHGDARFHAFRDVDYGFSATDITPFVEKYFELVGDDFENETRHKFAIINIDQALAEGEGRTVINAMFHKIGFFTERNEKRLTSLLSNRESDWCNDMLGVRVYPDEIILSPAMNEDCKRRIQSFARKRGIRVSTRMDF